MLLGVGGNGEYSVINMGKILDFLGKLADSELEITSRPVIVNNYFITIDNRAIQVSQPEFMKHIKDNNLKIENRTKLLEDK